MLLLLKFKWIFFLFPLPFSRNKAGDRVVRIFKIDLCIFLKKCFWIFITWILIVLMILYFGFLFYCMRLDSDGNYVPLYCSKNFIDCVSNPCVLQDSWNPSHFMVEKLNHWLTQGQNCWPMQSWDSDPCLLLHHNFKASLIFLMVHSGTKSRQSVRKKVKQWVIWIFQIDMH